MIGKERSACEEENNVVLLGCNNSTMQAVYISAGDLEGGSRWMRPITPESCAALTGSRHVIIQWR